MHTSHIHTVLHQSTGERHQVKMQQTGSEPPNRNPPELLVIHTSNIHTLFRYRRQHYVRGFSHIRTRYFFEGSVQQHPPPYSFRRRVRIKKKTPSRTNQQYVVQSQQQQQQRQQQQRHPQQKQGSFFFLGKQKKKRLASLANPPTGIRPSYS